MKRKRYPKEFKDQLIQEAKEVDSVPEVARRHEINPKTLYRWSQESKYKDWKNTPHNAKKVTSGAIEIFNEKGIEVITGAMGPAQV